MKTKILLTLCFILLPSAFSLSAFAQGTAFTYQGQLQNNGSPASGTYNLTFSLFNTNTTGVSIAGPVTNNAVSVTNGLFTVTMDFGDGVWNGQINWLEIGVETNGGATFASLTPRQQLTPAPYAIFAGGMFGLAVQSDTNGAPNLIGGSALNYVSSGTIGATIGGGGATSYFGSTLSNSVTGNFGTVGGGGANVAANGYTTVGGGQENRAGGYLATVAGGLQNVASGDDSAVLGGIANSASAHLATVGGGTGNTASGIASFVGGGLGNLASAGYATTAGGYSNAATTAYASVAGGYHNAASGEGAFVGGGGYDGVNYSPGNTASGGGSVVVGGLFNVASGGESTVGGGYNNTASGLDATVPGGGLNIASGSHSFAAGNFAQAQHNSAFVWSDGESGTYYSSDRQNQFKIQAGGGVVMDVSGSSGLNPAALRVNSTSGNGVGLFVSQNSSDATAVFTASGTGDIIKGFSGSTGGNLVFEVVNNGTVYSKGVALTSDRNAKENFTAVSPAEILARVAALPVSQWNYKTDPADQKHIGPMAQDFQAAFGLNGSDDKHISVVDEGGVALAAIQGLNQKVEARSQKSEVRIQKLEADNAKLQTKVSDLQSQLDALQKAVARLADKSARTFALNSQPQEAK
jgi:hypothetical protein